MSRTAHRAIASTLFVLAALVIPVPAQGASALLGPVLGPLPAYGADGGSGTAVLNDLVARTCNGGAALGAAQWFTLPSGNLGRIFARAQNTNTMYGYLPSFTDDEVALVDYVNGVVLSCTGGPMIVTSAHPTAVVAWPGPSGVVGPCSGVPQPCEPGDGLTVFVGGTSGVPANDRVANAAPVSTLPYSAAGDLALADLDGPDLMSFSCGGMNDYDIGNVWYRYTATSTGTLPVSAVGGNVAAALVTPSGPVGQALVGGGCESAVPVTAGNTYLLSVATRVSAGHGQPWTLGVGGAFTLFLGALDAPLPPGLNASPSGDDGVTLSWFTPYTPSGSAALTSFLVSRDGTDASGVGPTTVTVPAGTGSYTFTGLKVHTAYNFTVRGVNARGVGVPAAINVITGPGTDPYPSSAAGNLDASVDATARIATVTWEAAAPSSSTSITGYRVSRDGTDSGGTGPWATTLAPSARSFTFSHLQGGSPYRISVTPLTTAGDGPTRSVECVVLATPTVPGAPTSATWDYGAAAKTIVMTWKPPASDGQSPITGYRVARDGTDSGSSGPYATILPATARSFTLAALNPWYPYTLSVSAINAAGTGAAQSGTATLEADVPGAPSAVTAQAADTTASVAWAAPTETGTAPVTAYRIRRFAGTTKTVLATVTVGAAIRTYTWNGLSNATPYSFDVTSINAAGMGGVSLRSNVVTPRPPAPALTVPSEPIIGTATGTVTTGIVNATARWAAPVSNGGSPVLAYRVYAYRVSATGAVLATTMSPRLGATYRAWTMRLPIVSRYRFAVRAINSVGYSAPSAMSNLMVPARVPSAPVIATASSGIAGGTVTGTARWSAPASNGGTVITAYRVYAFRVSSTGAVISYTYSPLLRATTRTYTMTLPKYGWYRFAVRAVNAMGYSPFSAKSIRIIGR